ncbi:MAG TPA: nuclear transport factor 2 family protein [Vicinamibacterales bacterium]|nr:nuclear transport factor 2 family protein [Vicinamibacterales bacterium]
MPSLHTLAAAALLVSLAVSGRGQSPSADERAIRDLIARYDRGEVARTEDMIVFSGDLKRPRVGSQKPDELPPNRQPSARIPPERVPFSRRRVTTPVRIEIAQSGDLAYEFSNSELSFELRKGGRAAIDSSVLRVWKKDGGQWKIAAMFARPHDE